MFLILMVYSFWLDFTLTGFRRLGTAIFDAYDAPPWVRTLFLSYLSLLDSVLDLVSPFQEKNSLFFRLFFFFFFFVIFL
jgi:hypothetical protein